MREREKGRTFPELNLGRDQGMEDWETRTAKLERMSRRERASLPWDEAMEGTHALHKSAMKDRSESASSARSWRGEKMGRVRR